LVKFVLHFENQIIEDEPMFWFHLFVLYLISENSRSGKGDDDLTENVQCSVFSVQYLRLARILSQLGCIHSHYKFYMSLTFSYWIVWSRYHYFALSTISDILFRIWPAISSLFRNYFRWLIINSTMCHSELLIRPSVRY
jgi:hypothetical protein